MQIKMSQTDNKARSVWGLYINWCTLIIGEGEKSVPITCVQALWEFKQSVIKKDEIISGYHGWCFIWD